MEQIEVLVMWGTNVLHVAHVERGEGFAVGEAPDCDYVVPGLDRLEVVTPSGEIAVPAEMELPGGIRLRISVGEVAEAIPVGPFAAVETESYLFSGLSFLFHVGVLASLAFFMPAMGSDEDDALKRDNLLKMQHLLSASAEREQDMRETQQASASDSPEGGKGQKAGGEEGAMGTPNTNKTHLRYAVQGPKDNPDPHLAHVAALREAAEFGMIGLLSSLAGADPNAPTAPWGREDSSGTDPMSAHGNMWGDAIGDAFGMGGLGLTGTGEGGGCKEGSCIGVGLDHIGTIGRGAGGGDDDGFGHGHGRLRGGREKHPPTLRQGTTITNGRLPPEVIQRIVRQNFGRFKLCYEEGLRGNPSLTGRVAVKFIISRDGSVGTTQDGGSDIPDASVTQCVVRGFSNLTFPQPQGGIVTVVYPITFTPGD